MERQTLLWFQTIPCIIDAKYGLGVLVDAERNTQLMCYGIAALGVYESLYDIKEVSSQYSSQDVRMFKRGRYPWRS